MNERKTSRRIPNKRSPKTKAIPGNILNNFCATDFTDEEGRKMLKAVARNLDVRGIDYFPFCTRCLGWTPGGDYVCGKCQRDLNNLALVNRGLQRTDGNIFLTAAYLNFDKKFLNNIIRENYELWVRWWANKPDAPPKPKIPISKYGPSIKDMNKLVRFANSKMYKSMEFGGQREFMVNFIERVIFKKDKNNKYRVI